MKLSRLIVLVVLLGLLCPSGCGPATPAPTRPHVIVWLVDTLRADHLSAYGYARPTAPNIERLAAEGVLFEDAHVHANWTQPSVASILSGRHPPTFDDGFFNTLPKGVQLVSQWLQQQGYTTVGMTSTAATSAQFGFDRGFDVYREIDREGESDRLARRRREGAAFDADRLADAFLDWLEQPRDPTRPFFAYLHSVDPHFPYSRHEGMPSFTGPYDGPVDGTLETVLPDNPDFSEADRRHTLDLYDDEIRFNDAQLGRIIDALDASGLREHTLIIVVSDHGEEFWERDALQPAHGHFNLHRELTQVPFVVSAPGLLPQGLRVQGLMRGIDMMPTLLDWIGVAPLPQAEGESVAAAVGRAARDGADVTRLARDVTLYADRARKHRSVMSLRTNRMLYHYDPTGERTGLFDLATDAAELVDVSSGRPEVVADLPELLVQWRRTQVESHRMQNNSEDRVVLDAATRQALVELGYLEAGAMDPETEKAGSGQPGPEASDG